MRERPLWHVPAWIKVLLGVALAAQLAWSTMQPAPKAEAKDLGMPPSDTALRIAAIGEPVALGKMLMLYLQAFDYQAGSQVPYRNLDYDALIAWLAGILALDPRGQYPLMSASRLYAEVPDEAKQRKMLEFIYVEYQKDPNRRWPWLAHATLVAKHRLKDLPLARKYAVALQQHTTTSEAPLWVKQMEPFILEDMNELEAARIVIGGLLASGQVKDRRDYELLQRRLLALEEKLKATPPTAPAKP